MKIGVIIAMDKEFMRIKALLSHGGEEVNDGRTFVVGTMGDNEIVMLSSGIGKVNAAAGTSEMICHYHPDVIVSSGVAGGASVELNVQEVVASTQCVYHDMYCGSGVEYGQIVGFPARYDSDDTLLSEALAVDAGVPVHKGLIVTGDWFVDSREKMRDILSHFPEAMAVDMESCAIAHVCYLHKVRFISFRIISDIPLKDTNASQYFNFWDEIADKSFHVTKAFLESINGK